MTWRGRRLTAALAGVVALLFAGRWIAAALADRWWAAPRSPAAVAFLFDWNILRFTLGLGGVLVASAWFMGHLFLVYRAVGSVQVRRNVANLEFREALRPSMLLTGAIVSGGLIGLLVGVGAADAWREVVLAWHGVSYGVPEPMLGHDVGLYVAQLPLWRAAHQFVVLLVFLALGLVFGLYLVVGAVRWIDGRPAINNHARSHLGWLLTAVALALFWGYVLEPYELVAGLGPTADARAWRATSLVSPLLAFIAAVTAGLSAAWAIRPRHAAAAVGWVVLAVASVVGHWMVPPALSGDGDALASPRVLEHFERLAYGLEPLVVTTLQPEGHPAPPAVASLWNAAVIPRVVGGDSGGVLATDPAILTVQGRRRPVWLAARTLGDGRLSLSAIADDSVSPLGEPLFYQAGDSAGRPLPVSYVELGEQALRPGAGPWRINGPEGPGIAAGGWPRRVVLAWALQAGPLLGRVLRTARIDWHLDPVERVAKLAPFATWSAPVVRVVDGDALWLLDGYLPNDGFPLSRRQSWRGRQIGGLRAAFLATVDAETGVTRLYLRPGSDPQADAWADITRGVIEPASSIPEATLRTAPYPRELLGLQARGLERSPWRLGSAGGGARPESSEPPRIETGWAPDTSGVLELVTFERPGERRIGAILVGRREEGMDALRLIRFDSAAAVPARTALESRWGRFPTYDALSDSIRDEGGRLDHGPLRLELTPAGVVAWQSHFAPRGPAPAVLVWVTVAAGGRLGAGRTMGEAWSNLLGASVPSVAGAAQATRLDEARRWLERADSALRSADWPAFGRAWEGVRRSLGLPPSRAADELAPPRRHD